MATTFDVWLMERRADKHVKTEEWRTFLIGFFKANRPYNELAREILAADGADPAHRAAAKFTLDRDVAPDALTCASRTFPRGTYLLVKNLRTNRTVICHVNDYGPEAWTGRIIDLSRGSFRQIDDLGAGTAPVELRVASGPTGFNLPIENDVLAAVVGYNLCHNSHTPEFCEQHRQD